MRVRVLLPLIAGVFLLLAAPTAAEAACAQIWDDTNADAETAWTWFTVEFDPDGYGAWYDCTFYVEYGGLYASANYVAEHLILSEVSGVMSFYNTGQTPLRADAGDIVQIAGQGMVTVRRRGAEYLGDPEHSYVEEFGPYIDYFGTPIPPPSLSLSATNTAPVVNSGPVTVIAQYSGGPIEGPLNWSANCTPVPNTASCTFEPTQVGQHAVTASYFGLPGQVNINVQAVQESGTLKLFLRRGDGSGFDPANTNGTDDSTLFVWPGADVTTGESVALPQQMTLIAAFVSANGQVVAPPPEVTSVKITLGDTTRYRGHAMNVGTDEDWDYGLTNDGGRPQIGFTSFGVSVANQARIPLFVYDYGGSTKALATAQNFQAEPVTTSDLLGVPVNVPGGADSDSSPGNNNPGDGLSEFEEWRGFFIHGGHIRTSAQSKDLFVFHEDAFLGSLDLGTAASVGISVWNVTASEIDGLDDWINHNSASNNVQAPGHTPQRAIRVVQAGGGICDPADPTKDCFGDWQPRPGAPVRLPYWTLHIRIFSDNVREQSPISSNPTLDEFPRDQSKTNQTLAHEIGHALGLDHFPVSYLPCPMASALRSVMAYGFTQQSNGTDAQNCAWNNIPTTYREVERQTFKLK